MASSQLALNLLNEEEWAVAPSALWRDPRTVPAYACLLSLLALVFALLRGAPEHHETPPAVHIDDDETPTLSICGWLRRIAHLRRGPKVLVYRLLRLAAAGCLFTLSVIATVLAGRSSGSTWSSECTTVAEILLTLSSGYAVLLCILGLGRSSRKTRLCNAHAAFVLLIILGAFMYRDIIPLALAHGRPADDGIPWLMYSRVALSTLAGLIVPSLIPREYVPVDPAHPAPQPNPEQTASLLSFVTFTFMEPIVMTAYRNSSLPYDGLPPLADYDESWYLEQRSIEEMDPIIRRKRGLKDRHLFFGIMRIFRWQYVFFGFNLLFDVLSRFMAPFALNRILRYLQYGPEGSDIRPWVWIAVLLLGGAFSTFFRHLYIFVAERVQVLAENMLLQQIFRHAMRLRISEDQFETNSVAASSATQRSRDEDGLDENSPPLTLLGTETSVTNVAESLGPGSLETLDGPAEVFSTPPSIHLSGRINTLVGADVANILGARDFLVLFVMLPFQVAISTWFLANILGLSAIVGMGFMLAMMPIPGLLAKWTNEVEVKKMEKTEARVQGITEFMNVIRMIKMFGWENMSIRRLSDLRKSELAYLRAAKLLELFGAVLNNALPVMILIVTFSFHTLVMRRELDAATIFSSIAVLDLLRLDLGNAPHFINGVLQAKVSLDRLNKFLRNSPLLDKYEQPERSEEGSRSSYVDPTMIGMKNIALSWTERAIGRRTDHPFSLKVNELIFTSGKINVVNGPTGCGKTTLLMGLLGEVHVEPTAKDSWIVLPRENGVAYAAQEAWVQNTTIRNNITFLEPYDEARYRQVLYQCALEKDLAQLDAGDQTEVGEKGITLSGGQKARITLARAVYSRAEIVILDDILSALDVHTSQWIVNECLQGSLLANRTVILATHAIDVAGPIASLLVHISRGGELVVSTSTPRYKQSSTGITPDMDPNEPPKFDSSQERDHEALGKLTLDEELESGRLGWAAVDLLVRAFGGFPTWLAILSTSLLVYLSSVIGTWWLGEWARAFESSPAGGVSILFYLGIFATIAAIDALLYAVAYVVYMFGSLRASAVLHEALSSKVFHSTLRWLDVTPVGRIVSRFTQDISTVDGPLTGYLQMFISFSFSMLIQFGAVIVFAPAFVIPGILVALAGISIGQVYITARLPVRRLMSNWRSPLYTHFSAAVDGITSIRAYGAEETFRRELFKRLDEYTRPCRTFFNLDRWLAVRADMLGALFTSGLAAYLVYLRPTLGASDTGFALNMALGFSGLLLFWVRLWSEVETSANSVERIRNYLLIDQEPVGPQSSRPPAYWPASGELQVRSLEARYSPDGPAVLHDISFKVKSGERVGIVGRTGSGKSSLALSLLRLIPTTGDVYLDGILTADIDLEMLRSKMAIIPQDPALLTGTIRSNLDPTGSYDDAALNSTLQAVGLVGRPGGNKASEVSLDTAVASAGSNFSVGQRQLIALARAMVRGTKVLILDEATASVDAETDKLIQASIRKELHGTTLLTIAHRLQTIMDYDQILVMDGGRIVESDSPARLLETDGGVFRAMVDGSADARQLREIAVDSGGIP